MDHKQIFGYFAKCMPDYADRTKLYIKDSANSIKLRMQNGEEYIFTATGKKTWKLERVK